MTKIKSNFFITFALNHLLKSIKNENNKIIKSSLSFYSKKKFEFDPVTKFDLSIEKILRSEIEKIFPDHSVIGEELENKIKNSGYTWILDPIDGTKALLMGQPTWGNLISLFKDKKQVFGIAHYPNLSKTYYSDEKNSFVINSKMKKRISTSKNKILKNSKLVTNSIHTFVNKKIYNFFKNYPYFFKISGVDSYNFCLLAEGKIEIIIESGLKQVDILPIVSIVEKAGGLIVNWEGGDDLSKGQIIACSNKVLLKKFLNYFNLNYKR